jgi:hypothetical protein
VVLSICAGSATTWLVWSQGLFPQPWMRFVAIVTVMIAVYTVAALSWLSNINTHAAKLVLAAGIGLVVSLAVGGVICEVIHCAYDRYGCINL